MKKLIISFLAIAAALVLPSCEKDGPKVDNGVIGEWQLTSWSAEKPEIFEVYINFMADGTFLMYQKVEKSVFETFSGTYKTAEGKISGEYSDGIPWSTEYDYSLSEDGKKLTMTTLTDLRETSVYTRATIPEDAKKPSPSTRTAISAIRAL